MNSFAKLGKERGGGENRDAPGAGFWKMPGVSCYDRDIKAEGCFEEDDIVWIGQSIRMLHGSERRI